MPDDFSPFNKLSQLIPAGKTRDYTEVIIEKEVSRRRKKKKKNLDLNLEKDPGKKSTNADDRNGQPAGKLIDIIV
jgi:hypothetical protein